MATWRDVRRLALALPHTSETAAKSGTATWRVGDKSFVWERPLRASDVAALGVNAPSGAILGVRTADLAMKEALLAQDRAVFFTTPHFEGYAAVLVCLDAITPAMLRVVIEESWLARASKRIADEYLAGRKR